MTTAESVVFHPTQSPYHHTNKRMKTILIPLIIGGGGGLVAALAGVGGGVIMVPAFVYFLGLEQKQAIATSLAVIVPTAIVATFRYQATPNLIDWKIVAVTAVGAVLVAFKATDWMKELSNLTLTRGFAVLLIAVGIRMLFAK
ncbi:MAG: sulfite exporter TauE/SafE family protein [Verrucomicrobiota bacterium]